MAFQRIATFSLLLAIEALLTLPCHGGQYVVLKAPPSVQFDQKSSELLPISDIPLMVLAMFGYSPKPEMQWSGLYQISPFHTVDAAVVFTIVSYPGSSFDSTLLEQLVSPEAVLFPTVQDLDEIDPSLVLDVLSTRQSSVYIDARVLNSGDIDAVTAADGPLGNISVLVSSQINNGKHGTFNIDQELTVELSIFQKVIETLKSRHHHGTRQTQDFFHFRLEGLAKVAARHGLKSNHFRKALQKTQDYIRQAASEFSSLYRGNAVVQLVTTVETHSDVAETVHSADGATSHRRRQLLATETSSNVTLSLNLAPSFSWFYPQMFNIGLWFFIVFTLIVFFVGWCMWFIDPGYDSVIYRLTTPPKMKNE